MDLELCERTDRQTGRQTDRKNRHTSNSL